MIINNNIVFAKFIKRPNRFQAYVNINGEEMMVHVPNTGRCREILVEDSTVVLREETNPLRKTKYDLIAGYKNGKIINIDSQIPNKVVDEALKNKKIKKLEKYDIIEREKSFGNSRFDFKLGKSSKAGKNVLSSEYYLEVKGVTFEENGKAMFPDAPTDRGRKHLYELIEVKKSGRKAGVLFLIQMDGVEYFTPHDEMDKEFGKAVRLAHENGVDVFAYDCKVEARAITLKDIVDIRL